MKYDNAKLRQMLAAEYVIGTLRGAARRRFERLAGNDAALRAEIAMWEARFAEFNASLAPSSPSPTVWLDLQHRLQADSSKVTPIRRAAAPAPVQAEPKPAPLWRIGAGLAAAAAVVVAVMVGQRVPLPGSAPVEKPVQTATTPIPVPAPVAPATVYVALLKLPDATMQWTLSVMPQGSRVNVAASGEYAALGQHSLELWIITAKGPVAIGVLPVSGTGTLNLPKGIEPADTLTLAVSLEPVGGSPTGAPTGPVLTSGAAVKTG